MSFLTCLQMVGIFAAYLLMTFFLPAFLFYGRWRRYPFSLRFQGYFLVGNFYMMNVVFLLELLHISYRWTLIGCTVLVCFLVYFFERKMQINEYVYQRLNHLRKVLAGYMGVKTRRRNRAKRRKERLQKFGHWFLETIGKHCLETMLILGVLVWTAYIFGTNYFENYGYAASDIIVHHYWINGLKNNQLFIAGIYPFGYHTVIYFLSQVFGFKVLTLMRLFGLVQVIYVVLLLLAALSNLTKSAHAIFVSAIGYVGISIWKQDAFSRFMSPLPQEYGMLFIMPAVCFAILFFQKKDEEMRTAARELGMKPKIYRRFIRENRRWDRMAKRMQKSLSYPAETLWLPFRSRVGVWKRNLWNASRTWLRWLREKLEQLPDSGWMLLFFSLAFSMTLAVHFYDTIIAGIACVGIAIAFLRHFLQREYFWPVMRAGIFAILLAVYPFFFAYLGGTEFQSSMGWALSVMSGEGTDSAVSQTEFADVVQNGLEEGDTAYYDSYGNLVAVEKADGTIIGSDQIQGISSGVGTGATDDTVDATGDMAVTATEQSLFTKVTVGLWNIGTRIYGAMTRIYQACYDKLVLAKEALPTVVQSYIYSDTLSQDGLWILWATAMQSLVGRAFLLFEGSYLADIFALVLVLGLVLGLVLRLRDYGYGQMLFAMSITTGMLTILLLADEMGLPVLIDANRTRYFFLYFMMAEMGLLLDALLYFFLGWKFLRIPMKLVSFLVVCLVVQEVAGLGLESSPYYVTALETNGSIICTSSILEEHDTDNWTIVSANDELQMVIGSGYHTEVMDLLRGMEDYTEYSYYSVPSEYVYIYIEKVPLDYGITWAGSGSTVSEEGAELSLPEGTSLSNYGGQNRYIIMSRLYYWAKAFQVLYPNEMHIYYEDDEFICYEIKQDTYGTLNLAIDYGFNVGD